MGDERSIPPANTQYPGIEHEVLKKWTDDGEPGDANNVGDMYRDFASGLTEAAENLMVAVFGSQAGWTGQAANAMRTRLQKVAEWSQKTGDSFKVASSAFVSQGESVGTAKTSMPDPVQYNPGQMIKEAAASGNVVNVAMLPYTMYKQHQAQQQAHEKAIQVVAQRDAELAAAAASIPPFEPPPKIEDSGGKEPGPNQPGMPGSSGPRPGMPGGGSRGGVGGGAGGGAGGGGGGGFGGGGGIPGFGGGGGAFGPNDPNNPNGNGDDNQQTPPSVGMPSLPVGSGTGTSGFSHTPTNFGGGGPGGLPPGGIPGGAGPAGGGGGFGGAFGGGFGPGGAPRPGGGFGGMGAGGAAGAGASGGAGAGPGAGGMAGGRGAGMAGGRGAGGMGGGGMGAGRGQGGEDDEHQRPSYLVEPDPDATFGTDQMTAPPVIGG